MNIYEQTDPITTQLPVVKLIIFMQWCRWVGETLLSHEYCRGQSFFCPQMTSII